MNIPTLQAAYEGFSDDVEVKFSVQVVQVLVDYKSLSNNMYGAVICEDSTLRIWHSNFSGNESYNSHHDMRVLKADNTEYFRYIE